jgi:Zn-finger nucleic acid-binding protein
MPAETLNCPMCGAPTSSEATLCEHCGARLATVACPSCFGIIFQGAKFCSHCGAKADRIEAANAAPERCPRCQVNMDAVVIGKTNLRECSRCEGIWADATSLQQICADREQQAAVLGVAAPLEKMDSEGVEETIRYVPCPACNKLMNRVNFANCSHVVVDVCSQHGTWFDKDELRRIVEFIRGGGLEQAREREIRELGEQQRQLKSAQIARAGNMTEPWNEPYHCDRHLGISFAASVLKSLLG